MSDVGQLYVALSLPGGGIKGYVSLGILEELERRLERPLREAIDLVGGVSTGSIAGASLAMGTPVAEIRQLYRDLGPRVFRAPLLWRIRQLGGLRGPRYPLEGLTEALQEHLGDRMLSEVDLDYLAPAYDLCSGSMVVWKSHKALLPGRDAPLWVVAAGSSAVPTYFAPVAWAGMRLIDGGVARVDPAEAVAVEARRLRGPNQRVLVVTAGTAAPRGGYDRCTRAHRWGFAGWGRRGISLLLAAGDDMVRHIMERQHDLDYVPIVPIGGGVDMDDASDEAFRRMDGLVEATIERHDGELEALAQRIRASRGWAEEEDADV